MPTIIKAGHTGPILKHLTTVDLADHLAEADAVLERARRQASRIASDARRDAERGREEAGKRGYEAGYKQGYEEGTAAGREAAFSESVERFNRQQADIVAAMQQAVEQYTGMKEKIRIAAERDMVDFAVRMASRLTYEIGRLHREAAIESVARALRLVGSKTDLTIRVHPDDAEAIRAFAPSVLEQVELAGSVEIVEDNSFSPGGCRVSSASTDLDATLETQVGEMVALLLGDGGEDA
jgi:flagellar assembly protein FliH